jgi:hypothetical protein
MDEEDDDDDGSGDDDDHWEELDVAIRSHGK